MIPYNYYAVASQQVSLLGCDIIKLDGSFLGSTADRFLQVHDTCTTPAAGAVPARSFPLAQSSPFYFEMKGGNLRLGEGCFICVSTTAGTYTASADTMNITVETLDPITSGLTLLGDKTSTTTSLGLASYTRLRSLIITNNGGATGYLTLSEYGTNLYPTVLGTIADGQTKKYNFGPGTVPLAPAAVGLLVNVLGTRGNFGTLLNAKMLAIYE